MRSNKECLVEGHQDCKLSRICLYEKCNLQSRWCCAECVVDKIHLHDQQDDNHIKRQKEFIQQIYQQQQQYNNDLQPELNTILGSIQILISQLEKLKSIILQSNEINFDALISQANNDFLSLDNQQIEKLINFNKYGIQQNLLDSQNLLENIISELLNFQQLNKRIKNSQNLAQPIIQQQNQVVVRFSKCPNNHNLLLKQGTQSNRKPNCNSCRRKDIHLLGDFWLCRACNFDICIKCRYKKQDY